jgi:hypothetical protein
VYVFWRRFGREGGFVGLEGFEARFVANMEESRRSGTAE